MSAPAAISASLVNMRNVGTHKSVALTVHVPEELAAQVIEAFGWPTMANPVPVAIARLDTNAVSKPAEPITFRNATPEEQGRVGITRTPEQRRAWADLPPSKQAGIRSQEREFWKFLAKRDGGVIGDAFDQNDAARMIRFTCGVQSRAELDTNHKARVIWHQLDRAYMEATGRVAHG